MDYKKVKEKMYSEKVIGKERSYYLQKKCEVIEKLVKEEEIVEAYPKGIFIEKDVKLYLFLKDRILRASYNSNMKKYIIEIRKISEVTSLVVNQGIDGCQEAVICFNNSNNIILNSKEDTIGKWRGEFDKDIQKIAKFIYNSI